MFNPKIRGWLQYYGRYYRSALYPPMRQLDRSLAHWAERKYKKLRGHLRRATHWVARIRTTACAYLRRDVFRRAGCREIRLSGSARGEWVALARCRPLSYSTGRRFGVFRTIHFLAGPDRFRRGSFFLAGGLAAASLARSELASKARRLGAINW